jgi:hypothetical protein
MITSVGARVGIMYQPRYEATLIPRTWVSQTKARAAITLYLQEVNQVLFEI